MIAEIVLDSYAILAFIEDEEGAAKVEELLLQAETGSVRLLMNVVNLGEIWSAIARRKGQACADDTVREIQSLKITVQSVDWSLTHQAALFKMRGNLSYADCFAAAQTLLTGGTLVTGDQEFRRLEADINVLWLP